jgi:hypothetical protein
MAAKFTPTPEEPGVGSTHVVYGQDGKAKGTIFVPLNPICPECLGLNGGHQKAPRRKR